MCLSSLGREQVVLELVKGFGECIGEGTGGWGLEGACDSSVLIDIKCCLRTLPILS